MAIARTSNQIYINRDIDFFIEEKVTNKTPKVLFVHGQGGVGKSTLLKKFLEYEYEEIPTVFINLQDTKETNFVDILLNRDITTIKNCKNFEKIREMMLEEPKLFASVLEAYGAETAQVLKEIEIGNENYGLVVKTIVDATKLIAKFFKRKYEAEKKEVLNNIEFALIDALQKDFKDYGLLIVDTLEKVKNVHIKSRVDFKEKNIYKSHQEKNRMFKHYIEGLTKLFTSSTIIIAGRNTQDELNMDIPSESTEELSLENFSANNVNKLFELYKKNKELKLPLPNTKQLDKIVELTNGNALKVSLFLEMAREFNAWESFDFELMEERVKEDERYGLIFYMTDRVLSHLEEHKDIWKLVIPRVLTQDIERLLFKDEKILEKFIDVGLATKGVGTEWKKYYLHDDVKSAIEAYYAKEFKGISLNSWHDSEKVIALHQKLIEFYEQNEDLSGLNSAFEACYHKMMLRKDFERDFELTREEFALLTLSSISLNHNEKFRVCNAFSGLSDDVISELINVWIKERETFSSLMSQNLYERLRSRVIEGKSNNITKDIPFLEGLSKEDEFKNDDSLYNLIGSAYFDKKEYDNAIEAYQKAVEINPKDDEAYNNMGSAYNHKKEYDNAIEAYQKAVEINPKRDEAYYNIGVAYGKKQEYDNAIEAYQKAVEINPKKDGAYNNMGIAYYHLGEFDKVIDAYVKALNINPQNSGAYTGLFELQLIQNQAFDQALEAKYIELFQNQKESFTHYEMLKIFQAISRGETVDIEAWKQKYDGVGLDWGFDELREWIEGIDEGEVKARLFETLAFFEGREGV